MMRNPVILSPHFDDAILSMGDLISSLVLSGNEITVYNVFTRSSGVHSGLTDRLVSQAGFKSAEEYVRARSEEDAKAFETFKGKINIKNLRFIDAPWRKNSKHAPIYANTTMGVDVSGDDEPLQEKLAERFADIKTLHPDSTVFVTAGRGKGHIDHILARDAAKKVFKNVIYYADFAYGKAYPMSNGFIEENKLIPMVFRTFGKSLKMEAVRRYKTQLKALFDKDKIILPEELYFI